MHARHQPLRLMVVEDNIIQCMDLEHLFEEEGHEVIAIAQHEHAALAALASVGDRLDCVILDIMLAGTVAKKVTAELDRRGIRYVAVTGMDRSDLLAAGIACPHVAKPFLPERLISMVTSAAGPRPIEA